MNLTIDKQNAPTTFALILSIVILIVSLAAALWPKPNYQTKLQSLRKQSDTAEIQGKDLNKATASANSISMSQTWAGTGDEIGPTAYASLDKIASGLKVQIVSFRPGREVNAGDVTQLPYTLNITGSYKDVIEFVHRIESTDSKLAVELVQVGASDESTDNVTGTIGVEAYVLNAVANAAATTTTTTVKTTKTSAASKSTPAAKISADVQSVKETKNGRPAHAN